MILPTSIPSWQKIVTSLRKKDIELNLNVDPFNGKHGGTIFLKEKSFPFKIEVFPKNMVLSLKELNTEIIKAFANAFEFTPSITYEILDSNAIFKFHTEWYYRCEETEILEELNKLKNSSSISIIQI